MSLFHHKFHMEYLVLNPCLCGEQPAASCLSNNTAFCVHELHPENYVATSQAAESYLVIKSNFKDV